MFRSTGILPVSIVYFTGKMPVPPYAPRVQCLFLKAMLLGEWPTVVNYEYEVTVIK